MRFRPWLLASVGALVTSQSLGAQRTVPSASVHGVTYDALRGTPLPNAFVGIVGTARSTHSDSTGRFRFDSIPPGVYVFAMQHDALDSLGLPGVSTRVDVAPGGNEVRISVPSFAALWRVACGDGAPPPRDRGFVYGTVRDAASQAPVAGAFVDLTWVETRVDRSRGVTQRRQRIETRTGADGGFSVCGVPVAHWLRVGAGTAAGVGGPIDLPPTDLRVQRRDLLVAPSRDATMRGSVITGVLTDVVGAPVADARVVIDDTAEVRSGADGSFVIRDVPAGTRQIEVLSIGMRPVVTAVDVLPRDTATIALRLHKVTTLDVVRVTASRRGRLLAQEIEERRKSGAGYMLDVGDIERRATLSSVFVDMPSARVQRRGGDFTVLLPDGGGGMCEADVWVDGARSAQAALNMIQPREVAAVELFPRASAIPARYQRDVGRSPCGAILVWTNWALGRG